MDEARLAHRRATNSHEKSGSSLEGVAEGNGEASSGGGEVPGGSPTGGSGGKKSGWLGNLQGELNELDEPPAEATSSVWARQRELEVKMHAMVEKRVSERQERKRAAAARREERQRRREMSELCSDSDSEEEESDSGVGAQREAHALSLAQTLKDESVAKVLSQLPELEKKKAEAKHASRPSERCVRCSAVSLLRSNDVRTRRGAALLWRSRRRTRHSLFAAASAPGTTEPSAAPCPLRSCAHPNHARAADSFLQCASRTCRSS